MLDSDVSLKSKWPLEARKVWFRYKMMKWETKHSEIWKIGLQERIVWMYSTEKSIYHPAQEHNEIVIEWYLLRDYGVTVMYVYMFFYLSPASSLIQVDLTNILKVSTQQEKSSVFYNMWFQKISIPPHGWFFSFYPPPPWNFPSRASFVYPPPHPPGISIFWRGFFFTLTAFLSLNKSENTFIFTQPLLVICCTH